MSSPEFVIVARRDYTGPLSRREPTPTGSLMVLDAGDVLTSTRHMLGAYTLRDLRGLAPSDLRRARALLLTARSETEILIRRFDALAGYTRARKPAQTRTEEETSCPVDLGSSQ